MAWQDLFGPNAGPTRGHEVSFRPVTATGTYVPSDEVVVNARALNGGPGVWILTPLRLDSGRAVAVLRGFVPAPGPLDAPPRGIDPPAGRVTVTGIVQPLDSSPFPAPAGPSSRAFDNPDVARLATQVRYPLDPAYLQLRSSDPAQAGQVPVPLPPPTLDDGPHLNYAGQWFLFTAVVLIGWPLVLRRSAAQRDAERSGAGP